MRKILILITLISTTALIGCSTTESLDSKMRSAANNLPGVYKLEVQQGNVVTQDMIDLLRPGMDKRQVRFVLGTPLLIDVFHKNRWEYLYTLKKDDVLTKQDKLTVIFKDERLVGLNGNFKPSNDFKPMSLKTEVVDIPKREKVEPGLLDRALRKLGIEYEEKY